MVIKYMKRGVIMVLCLGAATLGIAQSTSTTKPTTRKPLVRSTSDNTLLWEITGKGLDSPSYLFGTMHILCANDAKLSANMKQVIKDCNQVYFEIDMDDMQEVMGAVKYLRMNDGAKISDLLTEEEFEPVHHRKRQFR